VATGVAAVVVTAPVGEASANPRRDGFSYGANLLGGAFDADGDVGPAAGFAGRIGLVVAEKFGLFGELTVSESWHDTGKQEHAGICLAASAWIEGRVSISVGVGAAVADGEDRGDQMSSFVADGTAVTASLGYDLKHWRRSALVVRGHLIMNDGDDGKGVLYGLALGIDGFELGASR